MANKPYDPTGKEIHWKIRAGLRARLGWDTRDKSTNCPIHGMMSQLRICLANSTKILIWALLLLTWMVSQTAQCYPAPGTASSDGTWESFHFQTVLASCLCIQAAQGQMDHQPNPKIVSSESMAIASLLKTCKPTSTHGFKFAFLTQIQCMELKFQM